MARTRKSFTTSTRAHHAHSRLPSRSYNEIVLLKMGKFSQYLIFLRNETSSKYDQRNPIH